MVPAFLGASIFWSSSASIIATLAVATIIGRLLAGVLPSSFRALARFYLAPSLGLAACVLIAVAMGWFLPLGDSVLVPIAVGTLLVGALVYEKRPASALRHAAVVSFFGLVCAT